MNIKTTIQKIKCMLGFHCPKEIGRAIYPYDTTKTILAMGCRYCKKKLSRGYLIDTDKLEDPLEINISKYE